MKAADAMTNIGSDPAEKLTIFVNLSMLSNFSVPQFPPV